MSTCAVDLHIGPNLEVKPAKGSSTFPIHDLPIELLDVIFIMACPIPSRHERHHPAVGRRFSWTCSQVCRKWRYRALDLSSLWNYMRTNELIAVPALAERAREQPLVVFLNSSTMDAASHPDADAESIGAINTIKRSMFRISELQIDMSGEDGMGAEEFKLLNSFLPTSAPMLTLLEIRAFSAHHIHPQLPLDLTRLTVLDLNWVYVPWASLELLTTLKELHIFDYEPSDQVLLTSLPKVLQSNQGLELFNYKSEYPAEDPQFIIRDAIPITLHRLSTLFLYAYPCVCEHILAFMDMPSVTRIVISFEDFDDPVWERRFFEPILPLSFTSDRPSSLDIQLCSDSDVSQLTYLLTWVDSNGTDVSSLKYMFNVLGLLGDYCYASLPRRVLSVLMGYIRSNIFSGFHTCRIGRPGFSPTTVFDLRALLLEMHFVKHLTLREGAVLLMEALDYASIEDHPIQPITDEVVEDYHNRNHACHQLASLEIDIPLAHWYASIDNDWFNGTLLNVLRGRRAAGIPINKLCFTGEWFAGKLEDFEFFEAEVDQVVFA